MPLLPPPLTSPLLLLLLPAVCLNIALLSALLPRQWSDCSRRLPVLTCGAFAPPPPALTPFPSPPPQVACCTVCNSKKGDKSLEQLRWKLRQAPKEPSTHEMEFLLSSLVGAASQDALPPEWQAYILPCNRKKKQQQTLPQAHQQQQ